MSLELDHVFVCVDRGAPEAEELIRFGLCEGPRNVHPGQGTANRRFFFRNAMLELLWVENPAEAQSPNTSPTHLWERWSGRGAAASPFGVIVRPSAGGAVAGPPFSAYEYRPEWLSPELRIHVSTSGVEEPMWLFMPFLSGTAYAQRFVPHPAGAREITGLELFSPVPPRSAAAQALVENGVLSLRSGPEHLLVVELDGGLRREADFRPCLPLALRI